MPSISEQIAPRIHPSHEHAKEFRPTAEKLLIDIAGLCVAARNHRLRPRRGAEAHSQGGRPSDGEATRVELAEFRG